MDIPKRLALCCAGLASVMLAGCAAQYPYQPYPYQPYPGGYYGQPNPMGPSMGVPPGGVQLNAPTPTPINPGTTNGGSSTGGDAPMWNPDNSGSGTGGSGGSNGSTDVPYYDDPSSGDLNPPTSNKPEMYDENKNAFDTEAPPFGRNDSNTAESPGVRNVAFESDPESTASTVENSAFEEESRESPGKTVQAPEPFELTGGQFEPPVKRAPKTESLSLPYNRDEIPNPFGHDAEGYRFLRGLVSYDEQLEAWSIIYNDKPARDDKFGGVFTLAEHPGLTVLNDNDVIYVEGHVSETLLDEFGKPCYIVEHLNKLKPRSGQ